jgi:hypothetical protein
MAAHIPESHIARAMRDDEMMAALCDDRPDPFEMLRVNRALEPQPEEAVWLAWGMFAALCLLVLAAWAGLLR